MDEFLLKVFEKYGLPGAITLFIFWDKFVYPKWKKSQGNYVSYKDLKLQIDKIVDKLELHLEKEAKEDILFATMKNEQDHFKEEVKEFKENQKAIFLMISEIKNLLIQKGL